MIVDILELIGITLLLGFAAYSAHKIRRIHQKSFVILREVQLISSRHLMDTTRQLQALEWLRDELKFDRPLPLTRGMAASPDFLLILIEYLRHKRPKTIIECGSGTSTIVLARMTQLLGRGHVLSLDHDAEFAEETRKLLARYQLEDQATVVHAPLTPHELRGETWPWYSIDKLIAETIDLLVIDGPPVNVRPHSRYPAGPILFPRLKSGGSAFLDDAAREDETEIVTWWAEENPGYSVIQRFAEKGCVEIRRDGTP